MKQGTLLQELEIYRSIVQYSDFLFSFHASNGEFIYVSPTCKPLLGYEQNELMDTCLIDFIHPSDRERLPAEWTNSDYERITYRFCKKEGDYIWLETTMIPYSQHPEQTGFSCITRDVTAQLTAEAELEEQKDMYRQLVENFQDTVGIITRDGSCLYINDSGKKLFGVTSKEEVIGKSIFDFVSSEAHDVINHQMKDQLANHPSELTFSRHDGIKKHVGIKLIPTIYKERESFHIVIRDLTEQKKTEELIHRTEKLSVVGQLAAGIAHEIRNPLTAIKGFTQLLRKESHNDYFEVMLSELERIEEIVSDLLILAKPQPSKTEKVHIGALIEDTIDLFKSEALLRNVEIHSHIQLTHQCIEGEADKLKQVYINLIKNAIEAMPDGGTIEISAYPENGKIITQIKDSGIGIPDERLSKLGEPFYSTKEQGTGLGLMICNRIIKNHNGKMKIESTAGAGTTIHVCFPSYTHEHKKMKA
ncbi:PAS domain S-box protein [Siminovitchia sediminis]|uniref:histidine kinase n=1 Tax=Siminovitchia sediminis TaxID=1274353 RepID=A0ABW4KFH2_9BACI